jgi:hypothetical protein
MQEKQDERALTPDESAITPENGNHSSKNGDDSVLTVEKPAEFTPGEITYPEGGRRGWAVAIGASVAIL